MMMIIDSLSNQLIYHISVSYGISWSKHYESINTGTACTMIVYSITFVKPASMTRGQQFIIAGHLRNFSHKQRLTRKWEQHSHSKLPRTVTYISMWKVGGSSWILHRTFFLYLCVHTKARFNKAFSCLATEKKIEITCINLGWPRLQFHRANQHHIQTSLPSLLPEASIGLRVLSLPASVCVCVCVSPCVNHELVRAITHDPYQLGSPNYAHRCKRPRLRSLWLLGVIDHDLQGQNLLQK